MTWLATILLQAILAASQAGIPASQAEKFAGPPQAKRGYDLFLDTSKGQPCGECHAIDGRGTAVGPDLKKIARLPARAFVMAILSTRTQYAVAVKPKTGDRFPAMRVKEDDKVAVFYDLSKTPPELRELPPSEIDSVTDNSTWKHPPESQGYTKEELADIIAYIKWAGYRSRSAVKASELD